MATPSGIRTRSTSASANPLAVKAIPRALGLGAAPHAADEREAPAEPPLDGLLVEGVVVRHHQEHRRRAGSDAPTVVVVADDAADSRDAPLPSPGVARVDHRHGEAHAREQRRHRRRHVTAADDEARHETGDRLEQRRRPARRSTSRARPRA